MSLNQEGMELAPHAADGLLPLASTAKMGVGDRGRKRKGAGRGPAVLAHMKYHKPTTKRRALKVCCARISTACATCAQYCNVE